MNLLLTIFLIDLLEARLLDLIDLAKVSNNRFRYRHSQNKPLSHYNDEFYDVVGIVKDRFDESSSI